MIFAELVITFAQDYTLHPTTQRHLSIAPYRTAVHYWYMTESFPATPNPNIPNPDDSTRADLERAWIAGICAGDAAAFEAMFKAYYAGLYRLARHYLHDPDAAEDLVHDVLLRVWEHRESWIVTGSLASYLFSAVRNRAIDYLRRRLVERRWREKMLGAGPQRSDLTPHAEPANAAVELSELDRAIVHAIERLPTRCRQVFSLCREQGLTYADTAAVMGISEKTVQVQMSKALKSLRAATAPFLGILFLFV